MRSYSYHPSPESPKVVDFECPYCYNICRLAGISERVRQKEWKRHIFRDLRPYICTFQICTKSNVMFERRTEWFRHETHLHRKEWSCNVAGHNAFQDKSSFAKHMEAEHRESFPQSQLSSVLDMCERPLESIPSKCPLCHYEGVDGLNPEQLEQYLARHMETLALFALASGPAAEASQDATSISGTTSGIRLVDEQSIGYDVEPLDFAGPDSEDQCLSDALIRSFCVVEVSRNTRIPDFGALESLFKTEVRERDWQDQILAMETANIIHTVKTVDPDGTLYGNYVEFLRLVYLSTREIAQTLPKNQEHMHPSLEENTVLVVQCIAKTFSTSDDIRTSLEDLEKDLCAALKSEQDVTADDTSWDYLKSNGTVADTTMRHSIEPLLPSTLSCHS